MNPNTLHIRGHPALQTVLENGATVGGSWGSRVTGMKKFSFD